MIVKGARNGGPKDDAADRERPSPGAVLGRYATE